MVAPATMKAIVLEESRGHPYAIHDARTRQALFPSTQAEAIATASRLLAEGSRIDAGLAQINSSNWEWLGLTAQTVFDPCTNLRAGERVILDAYIRTPSTVEAALSRYGTGDPTRGIGVGYVARIKRWMPAPPPGRDYESSARATEESREGGGDSAAALQGDAQRPARSKARPWSFVPATDGFAQGG
jgi:type IV secretion system protein VirB1